MACPAFRSAEAPPLGIMPRWLWDEHHPAPTPIQRWDRRCDLWAAMGRYIRAGRPVPKAWLDEDDERKGT